jgi:hypothetical protein
METTTLALLGALGGLVAFVAGVWALLRGIFRNVGATQDNTRALREVTDQLEQLSRVQNSHGERLARLEGSRWPPRGQRGR